MKAYVITTGVIFGLLTAAHVWRMWVERQMATEPWYVLITAASLILCVWAWRVVRQSRRPS